MATIADGLVSPGLYDDGREDMEDVVYPCKGCGEILEEGKAFELAGNRWHIDCFRCNTCGTLLDSDANLLLLGDGSLICNNCTYSCNACGNKIEDLAILTGDQAFCATCFRCRNCKRKIENLRYARTSQGIFCMSCHESLMARRRKKSKTAPRQAQGGASSGPAEKALPSLPPTAYPPDMDTPPSERHTDTPPLGRKPSQDRLRPQNRGSPANTQRDASPWSDDQSRVNGPTLPSSTYAANRRSNVSDLADDDDERGFLPMVFDNNPIASPRPNGLARKPVSTALQEPAPQTMQTQNENKLPRDYFGGLPAKHPLRDAPREEHRSETSTSLSIEKEATRAVSGKSSPHILYQDKTRQPGKRDTSGSNTPVTGSLTASPSVGTAQESRADWSKPQRSDNVVGASSTSSQDEGFKLQEVPPSKKAGSRTSSNLESKSPLTGSTERSSQDRNERDAAASPSSLASNDDVNPFNDPKRKEGTASGVAPSHPTAKQAERPTRGDSLGAAAHKSKTATAESPTPSMVVSNASHDHERKDSTSTSTYPIYFSDAHSTLSSVRTSIDQPPPRSTSRPNTSAPSKSVTNGDFIAPRQPPLPPAPTDRPHHRAHESISTMQSIDDRSDTLSPRIRSAGLPKHSAAGSFSMEDEMARILNGEKQHAKDDGGSTSVLRRVSNAVKHGRSFSDRGLSSPGRKSQSVSPQASQIEISSPMNLMNSSVTTSTSQTVLDQLRAQLKRAHQRISELESEKTGLEEKVNHSDEIEAASNELREKRNTMVVLDTQREIVVAELESMTIHLQKAKDSNRPLDLTALKSEISRDFADSLQKIKDQMSRQIEDLMHKRSELTNEIGQLIQMKDKGFQEYESVSAKNAQLLQMNNELVHSIQGTYKSNRGATGGASANGLGIYSSDISVGTPTSLHDARNLSLANTDTSLSHLLHGDNAEPATVLTTPQVVNIRKGQPKKFNWRKGGEKMAKNVTKGLKGAFVGDAKPERDLKSPYGEIGLPYNQTHQQALPGSDQPTLNGSKVGADKNAAYGLFNQKNGGAKNGGLSGKDGSNTNLATPADASVLFGSDLEARCEFEKRVVPSIVSRCIEEVELRGMEVEGVYRKSGGSGQVKTVQQGFEKDGLYDISDPDLDIHAVTSAMKQYFRKLPVPLITYDAYDGLLEAGQITDREKQAFALRAAVHELPEHHRNCLEYLIQHLARIMSCESKNLMTPLNLAVVFAPTIMRPLSIEREMSDMLAQRTAVQALLEQHQAIFAGEE